MLTLAFAASLVLLVPQLLLARGWHLPAGAATVCYSAAALLSATLAGFQQLTIPLAIVAAGVVVDLRARRLRPTAAAGFVTWTVYLGVASASQGMLPAVTEFWTGMPIITGLLAWLLAAVMLPNTLPGNVPAASEAQTPTGS